MPRMLSSLPPLPPGYLVYGLLLPATLVGLLLAYAWWRDDRGLHWPGPLGVALGWAIGFRSSSGGWPEFPPGRATEMLLYLGVVGGLMCVSEGARGPKPVSRFARVPLAVVAPWLLLRNLVERWETGEAALQLGAAALFLWASWSAFEGLARRRSGPQAPALLWCVVTAGSVGFLWTGSALYAQLAGTLAALFGAALAVSLVRPALSLAHGMAGAVGLIFSCLCIGAVHFSNLPPAAGALFGLAPVAALALPGGGAQAVRTSWKPTLLRVLLIAVPLGVGLYLAHLAAPPPNPYAGY